MKFHLTIIVLVIILISNGSHAQELQKLDERNGFKRLILGTSLEMVKQNDKLKQLDADKKKKTSTYSVRDLSEYTISGFEPAYVNLLFFDEKLMQVTIKMPNQPLNINGVQNKAHGNLWIKAYTELLDTYGRKIESSDNKIEASHSTIWRGNKVTLFFTRYDISIDFTELGFRLDFINNKLYNDSQLLNPTQRSDF